MKNATADPSRPAEPRNLRSPAVWIATGLGLGLITKAPGTVGSLIEGIPVAWAVSYLPGPAWQMAAVALLFAVGVPIATAAGRALGGSSDNQAIIYDEIITMPVVFLIVPLTDWRIALLGFALHRLFDITKPPPAGQLECLPEGLGVMADDLMAAIYGALALFGLTWFAGQLGWSLLPPVG
ncbi:MAG: phosphatidylglycerophosphatase A [Pirellulales bacterium]